jgi:signal peptidase
MSVMAYGAHGAVPTTNQLVRAAFRFVGSLLLAVFSIGAILGAVYVGVERIAFAPVLSPSMTPAFGPGDLVLTRPQPVADVRVGQILVLPMPNAAGQRYVHRVISAAKENGVTVVRTKGDANAQPEPYRLRITDATVPVVIGSVPAAGRLALVSRGTAMRIPLILTVGSIALVGVRRLARKN